MTHFGLQNLKVKSWWIMYSNQDRSNSCLALGITCELTIGSATYAHEKSSLDPIVRDQFGLVRCLTWNYKKSASSYILLKNIMSHGSVNAYYSKKIIECGDIAMFQR